MYICKAIIQVDYQIEANCLQEALDKADEQFYQGYIIEWVLEEV
jgi:hypothetical protein